MKLNNIVLILFFMVLANAKIIMIIRHGEKINDDYTDLSPQGKARAFCLINVFGSNGTYPSPQKIYAQSPSEKKQSTRPRDTVVPLANELGLQVDLSYESGKIKKLTENVIISSEEVILISWSNDKIPEIIEKFGIMDPPEWDKDVFDEIWILSDNTSAAKYPSINNINDVITGTEGYSLRVALQNIEGCISENIKNYQNDISNENIKESKEDNKGKDEMSNALKLSLNYVTLILSLISYIVINFYFI